MSACRKALRLYEKGIACQIKQNPKHFWRYVKSKLKVQHGMPNLEREVDTLTETDFDKAELLNPFFQKVYTLEDDSELPNVEQRGGGCYIDIRLGQRTPMIWRIWLRW